jgi:hypothetical protein
MCSQTQIPNLERPFCHGQGVRPLLICAAILIAMLIGFAAQPVAAHADHTDGIVSTAALDGLVADELFCGPGGYRIDDSDLCTHGPDVTPQIDVDRQTLSAAAANHAEIRCDGDGVSGKRVQVLYARTEDVADRFAAYVDLIRDSAADADAIFDASAHETGGHRHIRFVTNAECEIEVIPVVLPAQTDDTFAATVSALRTLGYADATRKYLIFMDASKYCGIASVVNDNQPGPNNRSNLITGYARVDNGCWDGISVAHELIHTLGGIQLSAPNSSGAWHCTDAHDIMCYSDAPYYPALRSVCISERFSRLLDCNHDDYFHTNPPTGSYLATHWNVADSDFLINTPDEHAALPELTIAPAAAVQAIIPGSEIVLEIESPTTTPLLQRVEFFQGEVLVASVADGPFAFTWRATGVGVHTITALVYDLNGYAVTLDPLTLTVVEANLPIIVDDHNLLQQSILLPLVMN